MAFWALSADFSDSETILVGSLPSPVVSSLRIVSTGVL